MAEGLTARVRSKIVDIDLHLDEDAGPVTVIFGPSGAGKTTLLRCIAGLDRPAPGSLVEFQGQVWDQGRTHLSVQERRTGLLFQDHALFPHLSVEANVAYGLHRVPRGVRSARVREALAAAGASHLHGRKIPGLSGGEAQRVALVRALAPRPRLLLLDEPLSALDAPTRTRLRAELRQILLGAGIPTLVVTHDRTEALALGDRMVVLIGGQLRQQGLVHDVFSRPADAEVAAAVEVENVLPGRVVGSREDLAVIGINTTELLAVPTESMTPGEELLVCVRAEEVALETPGDPGRAASPRNRVDGAVTAVTVEGPLCRVELDVGFPLTAFVTRSTRDELGIAPGQRLSAVIKAPALHLVRRAQR
jgi:molybdate transport system ATP-binding protein